MLQTLLRRLSFIFPNRGLVCLLTASFWLALAEVASAQPPNADAPSTKDYYLQYLLVGLCVALGLLAALRPSNRSDPEGGAVGWFGMAMGGGHGAEAPTRPGERRKSPHRGILDLLLAIVGLGSVLICCCIPLSIMAMMMAKNDLAAMLAGKMDRGGEGLTKAAFYIGMVGAILGLISIVWNTYYVLKQLQVI